MSQLSPVMTLFSCSDVQDGSNGDPDAGNLPQIRSRTMQGSITDVCLKRKIPATTCSSPKARPKFMTSTSKKAILNEH